MSSLTKCLSSFLSKTVPNLIIGDFNLRNINWINTVVHGENPNHIFASFNLEHGLQQLVNESTRENSILDLLLSDCASTVSNVHNLHIRSLGYWFQYQLYTCSIYLKKASTWLQKG